MNNFCDEFVRLGNVGGYFDEDGRFIVCEEYESGYFDDNGHFVPYEEVVPSLDDERYP